MTKPPHERGFWAGLMQAIDDIRHKVVEEPFFERNGGTSGDIEMKPPSADQPNIWGTSIHVTPTHQLSYDDKLAAAYGHDQTPEHGLDPSLSPQNREQDQEMER